MSGQITSNVFRGSGVIAATAGGLNWVSTVVTASTLTAEAGNGYWINTTSNTCTITLPSSASAGDQIVFIDYARTWGTNKIIIDSNGLNYQGDPDTYTVEYNTDGETLNIVYVDATQGWIPLNDDDVTDAPVAPPTQKAIFAFGQAGSVVSLSNLVNSSGVIATDTTGVGTARTVPATGYGTDKAIFAYGYSGSYVNMSNLVSNSGVVATDTTGVGTARSAPGACEYGVGLAIFGYGSVYSGSWNYYSLTNLVSNSGVVATDTTGVGTGRGWSAATKYGIDKGIFGYGANASYLSMTNLVSNVGVVGTDVSGVGTARFSIAATTYGSTGQAIFGYGNSSGGTMNNITNLVSNVGVVSANVTGVGTARDDLGAAGYGGDKAIFAYGTIAGSVTSVSNLVSSSGVVATDTTGVGTARSISGGAAGYSISA